MKKMDSLDLYDLEEERSSQVLEEETKSDPLNQEGSSSKNIKSSLAAASKGEECKKKDPAESSTSPDRASRNSNRPVSQMEIPSFCVTPDLTVPNKPLRRKSCSFEGLPIAIELEDRRHQQRSLKERKSMSHFSFIMSPTREKWRE